MCAPHPDVFTTMAATRSPSNASIVRRAISRARAWSPPWALRAPQQLCPAGATTSQPFLASTRAVARLCAPKTTDCTQPVSIATRPRRAPAAVEAERQVLHGRVGQADSSLRERPDENDAPPRRVHLGAELREGRTGRQTETAVDALVHALDAEAVQRERRWSLGRRVRH